jgi:hypothetical protein
MLTNFKDSFAKLAIWTFLETSVTIIAASIPFLRVLLKESSKRQNMTQGHGTNRWSWPTGNNTATCATTGRRTTSAFSLEPEDGRNGNVADGSGRMKEGILETNEVQIEYHSGKYGGFDSNRAWPVSQT